MAGTAQFNGEVGNIESNINKVDSFDESISEDAAKQKYPSVKCIKDIPHIIEIGTSGIWYYRKWSDGTAECWGKSSVSADTSTQWAGYYTGVFGAINYPSNLFVEEPVLNCTLKTTSYPGHMFLGSDGSKSSTGGIAVACHDERTVSGYLHLTVKGKWK